MTSQELTEIQKLQRYVKRLEEQLRLIANIKDIWRWRAAAEEPATVGHLVRIEKELGALARRLSTYFDEVPPGAERSENESAQTKN